MLRDEDSIAAEAALDGIYVLRTTIGADELDTTGVISAYKDLAGVEQDFRSMKAIDVDIRPVHHYLEDRVRAHAFLCFLATYVTFHLRDSLAPLTFTDTAQPERTDPVAPAPRLRLGKGEGRHEERTEPTGRCVAFASSSSTSAPSPATRCASLGTDATFDLLATPTPTQRRVFELLSAPVPKTLV